LGVRLPILRRHCGEIVEAIGGEFLIYEAERLTIELRTGRDVAKRPEVLLIAVDTVLAVNAA
jgi:hypothetical protein